MIPKQACVATLLLIVAVSFGTGCDKGKQVVDNGNTSDTSTGTSGTDTGTTPDDHHHPLTATHYKVTIKEEQGSCYADQPWVSADPASGDTVEWSSGTGAGYLIEFHTTPLKNGTSPQYVVAVPKTGASTAYPVFDSGGACRTNHSLASCYFQYTITKVANNPTNPSDFCGPAPMMVGIHIKP